MLLAHSKKLALIMRQSVIPLLVAFKNLVHLSEHIIRLEIFIKHIGSCAGALVGIVFWVAGWMGKWLENQEAVAGF
jgi:type III secretory pathway component EscT